MSNWKDSLVVRIGAALLLLFTVAATTLGFTLYELDLRKHDYVILNLTGRLSGIAAGLGSTSNVEALRAQLDEYSRITSSLRARLLEPELTGRADPLRCSWDEESIAQLDHTAEVWEAFRARLEALLGRGDHAAAAALITREEAPLRRISLELGAAFQRMMEGKLALIMLINQLSLLLAVITIIGLMWLLQRSFVRPLRLTLDGMQRVARGDFAHRIKHQRNDELGRMGEAFNHLGERLDGLFRLTRRIDQAATMEQTLEAVFEEFSRILPLDWLGMLSLDREQGRFLLERRHSHGGTGLEEGSCYGAEGSLLLQALESGEPLHIDDVGRLARDNPRAEFAATLAGDGRRSALFFPLQDGEWGAILAFAVREGAAYGEEHLELLSNIAAQVGHGLGKTVFTENLVISAIEGLAKLAESRDPETGDHLLRMSIYSALIAEELGREGPYQGEVSPQYVRDIRRFAPMHDIGKVGIEDAILLKPGRLDEDERADMERHPIIGAEVLRRCEAQMQALGRSVFNLGIEIAEGHHEKYDGSGYPKGIKGGAIPLSARIVACADVFDALTSRRPYKEAWPLDKALSLIADEAGGHFDPEVVAALQRAMPRVLEVYERLKHV